MAEAVPLPTASAHLARRSRRDGLRTVSSSLHRLAMGRDGACLAWLLRSRLLDRDIIDLPRLTGRHRLLLALCVPLGQQLGPVGRDLHV
mmetsp:Transcript_16712/g.52649  ORF Transcript_16712/g.52649 Transcript_16712/m.52649 type:complete len:89 (+) Transcript_16712:251-517(+)